MAQLTEAKVLSFLQNTQVKRHPPMTVWETEQLLRAWLDAQKPGNSALTQQALMRFDPATGDASPYPSHAQQWREFHGDYAWLFNPWTGDRRHAGDVGSDPFGQLIVPNGDEPPK
jgi:hypothetical protein